MKINGTILVTRQYIGGAIAGFGLCLTIVKCVMSSQGPGIFASHISSVCGILMVLIGGVLARS